MPPDDLNDAVVLLDGAIEHANRWPPQRSAEWAPEQFQQAREDMERAIGLLQQADKDIRGTRPGGVWGVFDGDPIRPHLERAISLAFEARGIVERVRGEDREPLGRASKAIHEAWDIMAGVALIE